MLLHAENEINEHSQQVGRLYGKVRKGCTAGSLTAHGADSILDYLHNQNMGIGVSLKVPKCEIFYRNGFSLFGTDPDRNRVTWETPSREAIPNRRKPLRHTCLLRNPAQTQV